MQCLREQGLRCNVHITLGNMGNSWQHIFLLRFVGEKIIKEGERVFGPFLLVVFGQGEKKKKKKTTSGKYFSYQHDTFESLQTVY